MLQTSQKYITYFLTCCKFHFQFAVCVLFPDANFSIVLSFSAPVFGAELGAQFRPTDRPAPIVVMKCVQAIEKGDRIRKMGIYSIVPSGSEKNALKTALNQSETI